ncbi:MAG TPA: hypothetical protein VEO56_01865 [Bacteroidota bacterium]|nr:hypothetical protein [Bacteroidota bacterium]
MYPGRGDIAGRLTALECIVFPGEGPIPWNSNVPGNICTSASGGLDQVLLVQLFRSFSYPVKPVLSILTALALMFGSLHECVVILSFEVNRPFIAKNLCEKRDKPGNTCRGSCQLCKQLNNDDQKAQSPAAQNIKELDNLQPAPLTGAFRLFAPGSTPVPGPASAATIPNPPPDQIDHPPKFILA